MPDIDLTRPVADLIGDGDGLNEAEAGFTLIELMVVLLIIAILLAIAIPTFLGVANSAGDRATQSNLSNALTEVKALYQNSASYAGLTTATFSASAPEFAWVSGAGAGGGCSSANNNCVSVQIVDASSPGDGQGVVLAAYSPKDQTCWYAVDLESTPAAMASDLSGTAFVSGSVTPTGSATNAGVYYATKTSGVTASNCNATWAATTNGFNWGLSYASAGTAA